MKQVYGDSVQQINALCDEISRFKKGQAEIFDDEGCGRPTTSTSEVHAASVLNLVEHARRVTVDDVSMEVGISHGGTHSILTDKLMLS